VISIPNNRKDKADKIFDSCMEMKCEDAKPEELEGPLRDILANISEEILNTALLIRSDTPVTREELVKLFSAAEVEETADPCLYVAVPILNVTGKPLQKLLEKRQTEVSLQRFNRITKVLLLAVMWYVLLNCN
jgi:hypothetical protein